MAAHDRPRGFAIAPARGVLASEFVDDGGPVRGLLCGGGGDRLEVRLRRCRRVRRHGVRRARRPRGALDAYRKRVRQGIRQPVRYGFVRRRAGHRHLPMGSRPYRRVRSLVAQDRLAGVLFLCRGRSAAARALQLAFGRPGQALLRGVAEPVGGRHRRRVDLACERSGERRSSRPHRRVRSHGVRRCAHDQPLRLLQLQGRERRRARALHADRARAARVRVHFPIPSDLVAAHLRGLCALRARACGCTANCFAAARAARRRPHE